MNFLKKIFTPNAHVRRIMSCVGAAFVLLTILISSAVLVAEADHDCSGHGCQACLEMQACVANLQLVGSSAAPATSPLPESHILTVDTVPRAHRAPATTLQSLDVRFDE